jgi:chemotaxis family two-component system response regulator Rcp1
MDAYTLTKPYEILLVEDSATDARLVSKALAPGRKKSITTVVDGEQAMAYLHERAGTALPDLMLLDLNLPKKDGWEVLAECKNDPVLRAVPIVVFTTSQLEREVHRCYELGANSFVAKPFELDPFLRAVKSIEDYWLGLSSSYKG